MGSFLVTVDQKFINLLSGPKRVNRKIFSVLTGMRNSKIQSKFSILIYKQTIVDNRWLICQTVTKITNVQFLIRNRNFPFTYLWEKCIKIIQSKKIVDILQCRLIFWVSFSILTFSFREKMISIYRCIFGSRHQLLFSDHRVLIFQNRTQIIHLTYICVNIFYSHSNLTLW